MSDSTVPAKATGVGRAVGVAAIGDRAWALVVWSGAAVWSTALFLVVRDGYESYRIGRYDFGNMVQAVWSTVDGRLLDTTDGATGEQISRLSVHADPLLVLLSPLWVVWPSPLVLALAQIVAVSLGALPVFWLGRRHLGSERTAALLALGYLAYPWVVTSAASAIHPVTFAVPFALYCIWFLDTDRLAAFAVFALLVMSTGELMGLPIFGLGIWYALARRRRVAGLVISSTGLLWTVIAIYVIVPSANGGNGGSRYYGFYDEIGGSPQGVLRTFLTDPGAVLGAVTHGSDLAYVLWLTVPLCGLFLLAPGLAAVGLPQLIANMLSDFPSMTDPRYHSLDAVVPFLVGATVFGVARLPVPRRSVAAGAVLVTSVLVGLAVGPWPRLVGAAPLGGRPSYNAEHIETLRQALALVPDDAPVVSTADVGAHLSSRRYVYTVPVVGTATWALLDLQDPWATRPGSPLLHRSPGRVRRLARELEQDTHWQKVFDRGTVLVFRRSEN
jgi:uncharacterized membrane protein